jgi:hypothetical protein
MRDRLTHDYVGILIIEIVNGVRVSLLPHLRLGVDMAVTCQVSKTFPSPQS